MFLGVALVDAFSLFSNSIFNFDLDPQTIQQNKAFYKTRKSVPSKPRYSSPGIGGTLALPPVAMTALRKRSLRSATWISFLPKKVAFQRLHVANPFEDAGNQRENSWKDPGD